MRLQRESNREFFPQMQLNLMKLQYMTTEYLVLIWILCMSVLGAHGHPILIVFYVSLAIWTYSICLREVGDNLIYELYLLKHTLLEIIKLFVILCGECIAIYWVSFADPNRNIETIVRPYDAPRDFIREMTDQQQHFYIHHLFVFVKAHCFSASSLYFVSWGVILCFSAGWVDYRKNKWRVSGAMLGTKFLRSILFGHSTRIIAFLITTLPSQFPNCTSRKLHMDADTEWNWKEAATHRGSGGCNDLMFSGHFVVIMNACLLFNEVYGQYYGGRIQWLGTFTTRFVCVAAGFAAMDMVRGGHHYSVDVYLAFLVTMLYWKYASHPSAYWYVPLELKSKRVQSELRNSCLMMLVERYNINTEKRQKILLTILLFFILFLVSICLLYG